MQVKDMMHQGAEYVAPNAKLQVIAKKMRDHDVGAIPVCEGDKTIGMVTDRDIAIRALANGKDIAMLEAKDVMSKDVVFCRDTRKPRMRFGSWRRTASADFPCSTTRRSWSAW